MAHLIQPIEINSTLYCVDEQGNMRTEVLLFDGASDLGGNFYQLADWGGSVAGSIKFGTSCASEVTIAMTSDGALLDSDWEINVNGVLYDSGNTTGAELDETIVIALTPSPCGNIIELVATITDAPGTAIISAAIVSIT